MLDWLLASIDSTRPHEVGELLAWHGRLMVVSWGILVPVAVLVARFGKVWPGQDWPNDLDNPNWWRIHWATQSLALAATIFALLLVLQSTSTQPSSFHHWFGYCVIALGLLQLVGGIFRGSKGGPTDGQIRGDHFDMTRRRIIFEIVHKGVGYLVLLLAVVAILTGLWTANAPNWMFVSMCLFWGALVVVFCVLQRNGHAIDTYQAIWGVDPKLPGNQKQPIGWGIRRVAYKQASKRGRDHSKDEVH